MTVEEKVKDWYFRFYRSKLAKGEINITEFRALYRQMEERVEYRKCLRDSTT